MKRSDDFSKVALEAMNAIMQASQHRTTSRESSTRTSQSEHSISSREESSLTTQNRSATVGDALAHPSAPTTGSEASGKVAMGKEIYPSHESAADEFFRDVTELLLTNDEQRKQGELNEDTSQTLDPSIHSLETDSQQLPYALHDGRGESSRTSHNASQLYVHKSQNELNQIEHQLRMLQTGRASGSVLPPFDPYHSTGSTPHLSQLTLRQDHPQHQANYGVSSMGHILSQEHESNADISLQMSHKHHDTQQQKLLRHMQFSHCNFPADPYRTFEGLSSREERGKIVDTSGKNNLGCSGHKLNSLLLTSKPDRTGIHFRDDGKGSQAPSSGTMRDIRQISRGHVRHDYHDYASLPPPPPSSIGPSSSCEIKRLRKPPKTAGKNLSPQTFPMVLHDLLERADEEGYNHIVSWQPHGRAFLVHDSKSFVSDVMKKYFKQSRFPSFQRQLALYGFLRLSRKGPDHGAYYHEMFLRGRQHLCARIERTRVKGHWVRQTPSPATEPDFYSMAFLSADEKQVKSSDRRQCSSISSVSEGSFSNSDSDEMSDTKISAVKSQCDRKLNATRRRLHAGKSSGTDSPKSYASAPSRVLSTQHGEERLISSRERLLRSTSLTGRTPNVFRSSKEGFHKLHPSSEDAMTGGAASLRPFTSPDRYQTFPPKNSPSQGDRNVLANSQSKSSRTHSYYTLKKPPVTTLPLRRDDTGRVLTPMETEMEDSETAEDWAAFFSDVDLN